MRRIFRGSRGLHGSGNSRRGRSGENERVRVPVGTEVYDQETGFLLKDLARDGEDILVCQGGPRGKGNHRHAVATRGGTGEKRTLRLELKLVADVGLVGYPNAGKSTLISRLSNARSRIAPFPFTTKEPILGVLKGEDSDIILADIPGLIEGAHRGKGMGIEFLRHIERTSLLIHVVDMAATENRDPWDDYAVVNRELARYSRKLMAKGRVIAANKMDLPQAQGYLVKFESRLRGPIFPISAATGQGLRELVRFVFKELGELKASPRSLETA